MEKGRAVHNATMSTHRPPRQLPSSIPAPNAVGTKQNQAPSAAADAVNYSAQPWISPCPNRAQPKLLPQNKCPEIPEFKEPMFKFKTDLPSISIFLWLLQSREKESREKEKKRKQEERRGIERNREDAARK